VAADSAACTAGSAAPHTGQNQRAVRPLSHFSLCVLRSAFNPPARLATPRRSAAPSRASARGLNAERRIRI